MKATIVSITTWEPNAEPPGCHRDEGAALLPRHTPRAGNERQTRDALYRAAIAEACNAATDETALFQIVTEQTAWWANAAAFATGQDLAAFATDARDPQATIAALFRAVATRTPYPRAARVHTLREVAITAAPGIVRRHDGYHTLAIAPVTAENATVGALLAAARGSASPFDAIGLTTLARAATQVGVAVTRIRQTTRLQQEVDALTGVMRHKDDFLAAVSHELRTPLTAILGFAHIIVENDALGAARRRGMAEDIVASGGLLLTQVNDLLDIVQLGAGRLSVPLEHVDIAEITQWCARAVAAMMKGKELAFRVAVAPDMPAARANTARLEQVMLNLLVNAYKFTPAGGEVTLSASVRDGQIALAVADTGIGIAPEHLGRIFEPFERIETEYSRTQAGAGVGLAVARQLVEMMHGSLTVESAPGLGSVFTVSVPAHARDTSAQFDVAPPASELRIPGAAP